MSLRTLAHAARRVGPRRLLLLLAVAAIVGTGLARTSVDTGVASFLPADDPAVRAGEEVAAAFGGDPVVVLLESTPGAFTSPEGLASLLGLEGSLARLPDVAAVYGPATVLNQVTGRTQDLVGELVGYRDGLYADAVRTALEAGAGEAAAEAAGRAATREFDVRYAPLLLQGMPGGLPTLRNEQFVRAVVYDESGSPRPQWRFVLPGADAATILVRPRQDIDQAATERLVDRVGEEVAAAGLATRRVTVSGVPAITASMAGGLRTELPVLGGAALLAVGAVFLLVRWTGRRHRLLPLASAAVATAATLAAFGLAGRPLTLPAVAVLPILLGVGSDFMTYLECRAGRRTVVTVGLATAAAFAALAATPVRAVADLGIALALGTLLALGTGLLFTRWFGRATPPVTPAPARRPGPHAVRVAAAVAAVAAVAAGAVALPGVGVRADVQGFAAGTPALADARHVEDVIGSSGELTVAVAGPDTVTLASLDWMQRLQNLLIAEHGDQVRPVLSPPTLLRFLGDDPSPTELDSALRLLPGYLTSSVVRSDRELAVLTFAVRLQDAASLQELRDDVLARMPAPPDGLGVRLTGLPMAAVAGYEAVSDGRYLANVLGIGAAGLVLLLGLRHRADAARAMAAATLATAVGVLALWVTGTGFTPITVALGSLTAAVGCEFSVLLAEAARRSSAGLRRAVALAAAVSATGYATLALSGLAVVREFGLVLSGSVVLAFAAAMFVQWLAPARADAAGTVASVGAAPRAMMGVR